MRCGLIVTLLFFGYVFVIFLFSPLTFLFLCYLSILICLCIFLFEFEFFGVIFFILDRFLLIFHYRFWLLFILSFFIILFLLLVSPDFDPFNLTLMDDLVCPIHFNFVGQFRASYSASSPLLPLIAYENSLTSYLLLFLLLHNQYTRVNLLL